MAATDNIIGMIIVVSVLLIGGLVLQTNQLNQSSISVETNQGVYEQQKISRDVESILQVTEPVSKLKLSKIITNIIYSNKGMSNVYGFDFNQIQYVEDIFDSIYGQGNYFVEIKPPVSKARIIFIIDGSSSMENDISTVSKLIPRILKNFNDRNYIVESTAYILTQGIADNPVKAINFSNITAVDIAPDNVIGNASSGCGYDSMNLGIYNKYFFNDLKKGDSNYFIGFDLYTTAPGFTSIPSCAPLNNKVIRGQHYEDWATGTVFVAKNILKKSLSDKTDPTLTILVPMSDEITSGAEADSCYDSILKPNQRFRCELCETDSNRFTRANKLVKFAADKLDEENLDYFVFPVAIKPEESVPIEDKQKFCGPNGEIVDNCSETTPCFPCCDTSGCDECKSTGDNIGVHNNENVINNMLSEMDFLASSTGGRVIDLTKGYADENEFLKIFLNSIEKLEPVIKIGENKPANEKTIVKRLIPTSQGTLIEMRIGLYKNTQRQEIQKLEIQNLPPSISLYYSPSTGVIKNKVPFIVTLDARNSFDPEGEELKFTWKKEGVVFSTKSNDTITISTLGDHNFELMITDNKGSSATKKFTVKATEMNTKARLIFVPVNWDSGVDLFNKYVQMHAINFTGQISCKNNIEVVILDPIKQNCFVDPLYTGYTTPLDTVYTCAQKAGYNPLGEDQNSRVIGITDDTISVSGGYTILGYTGRTPLNMEPYPIMATFKYTHVTSHEIGHTFAACDEYSLHEWLRQDNSFTCPNPYPLMCGYDAVNQIDAPTQMRTSAPYCSNTIENSWSGTYLNCKDFFTKVEGTSCGDNYCNEATETGHTCPKDCLILDCPGELMGVDKISVMGSVLSGDYSSRDTVYSSSLVETIEKQICN